MRAHPDPEPTAVLTGDSLFIGDVGRPDLVNIGDTSTTDLARAMYHSIHDKLLALPDTVTVMPAHGAGSSCGKNLSTELTSELTSTIGEQRRTNPSVQPMSEDEFVEMTTHGQPAAPSYFTIDAAMNKPVHPLLDRSRRIPQLTSAQIRSALDTGIRVVDARSVDDFAAGHLHGSIYIGFDGRFGETGGMVADVGDKIALITYPGEDQFAALRLSHISSGNVIGYLNVNHDGAFPAELADLVRPASRVTVTQLDRLLAQGAVTVIDIRTPASRRTPPFPARSTSRWPSCGFASTRYPLTSRSSGTAREAGAPASRRRCCAHTVSDKSAIWPAATTSGPPPTRPPNLAVQEIVLEGRDGNGESH